MTGINYFAVLLTVLLHVCAIITASYLMRLVRDYWDNPVMRIRTVCQWLVVLLVASLIFALIGFFTACDGVEYRKTIHSYKTALE